MLTEGHHWLHILLPQNIVAADTYIILIYKFLYVDTDSENYMFYQTVFKTHYFWNSFFQVILQIHMPSHHFVYV